MLQFGLRLLLAGALSPNVSEALKAVQAPGRHIIIIIIIWGGTGPHCYEGSNSPQGSRLAIHRLHATITISF